MITKEYKKNPTWAWVWDGGENLRDRKRILICGNSDGSCLVVANFDMDRFFKDLPFEVELWNNHEIVKPKKTRPMTAKEIFELGVVKSKYGECARLVTGYIKNRLELGMQSRGEDEVFSHYTKLDGTPLEVEVEE